MRRSALTYHAFGPPRDALSLVTDDAPPRPEGSLRVAMIAAPVNPSDLIPVTGAYAHRISLPAIAGYEGVGRVIGAPGALAPLIGQRVLPLRGPGTWASLVDCDPALAVPVPEDIPDKVAARAYINPFAALRMLTNWPVRGKHVLLSGAGSTCADLLGLWALENGALSVTGLYRSESRATQIRALGITPLPQHDTAAIEQAAALADVTFDALGGPVATRVLSAMRPDTDFVGYGLLTGKPLAPAQPPKARYARFHLRDDLAAMSPSDWQAQFAAIWPKLRAVNLPAVQPVPLTDWQRAIDQTTRPGAPKPLLIFP